jgi:hypothetical protein
LRAAVTILFFLLFATLLLPACRSQKNPVPDMTRSFSLRSKKPMGTYIAHRMFLWQFHPYLVQQPKKDFSETIREIDDNRSLYFIVADKLILSDEDLNALLRYVDNGNQLFISAAYFDRSLMDTLQLKAAYHSTVNFFDSSLFMPGMMKQTSVSFYDTLVQGSSKYGFFYFPFERKFTSFDSSASKIISVNENNEPDCISFPYGNGRIFMHLHPEVFSNYFLLKKNNRKYAEQLLSYVSQNRNAVYWDDYYRMGLPPSKSFSSFGIFLKYEPLRWALWLAVAALLLYLLTGSKRRQRAVPVLEANTNSSVSFVETIGRLYLQKRDHHNIVHKMVTYFLERVRNHYYLNTSQLNREFFSSLSRKSGIAETEVKELFEYITQLQETPEISDLQLLELNNRMLPYFKS